MTCRFSPDTHARQATLVDNLFINQYLPRATGVQAAVYLYGLMQCAYPDTQGASISQALGITPDQERDAFLFWQTQGLVEVVSLDPLQVLYRDLHQLDSEGTAPLSGRYSAYIRALENLFAPRQLSAATLRRMQDWVDTYGFSEEAALLLAQYCVQKKGKRIGIRYMDTVADAWAQAGVCTLQEAQEQIQLFEEQASGAAAVLKRLRILRLPTADEQALYAKWTQQWNMEPGAILEACALMVGTQQPNLKYLDSILEGLCRKGIRTPQAVRADLASRDTSAKLARLVFERGNIAKAPDLNQRRILCTCVEEGMPVEVLLCAADNIRQSNGGAKSLMELINAWRAAGIRTVADAQRDWSSRKARPSESSSRTKNGKNSAALAYIQQQYTDEELLGMAVDLDEDE